MAYYKSIDGGVEHSTQHITISTTNETKRKKRLMLFVRCQVHKNGIKIGSEHKKKKKHRSIDPYHRRHDPRDQFRSKVNE